MNKNICKYAEYNKYKSIECKVCENKPCLYQRYCTQDSKWWCSDKYFGCERRNSAMSKKKKSTDFINTDNKDAEIVSLEAIEVAEIEEVVSDEVEIEKEEETISQETEPSKEVKFMVSKEQGKIISMTDTTVKVLLKDGSKKVIKKPNYPVKLRDMIDTTI